VFFTLPFFLLLLLLCSYCSKKDVAILMVFASGIRLNTIMSKNNVQYGEFVSLVKNNILELQEA
jgi:hypothetical protein